MRLDRCLGLLILATCAALGAPSITAVRNAASNIPAGLPNAGIAQGALFIIAGADLGPPDFVVADTFPLQTSIAGTSVKIVVNGTTVDGIMYYSGSPQVAVILPSATPVGDGTVTVTYNGETSPPFPIQVVSNGFGVFTVSQNGSGDAIAFRGADLVTPGNAANPFDVVSFWGTGLSAVDFDESAPAEQFDMTGVPIEAFVGGRKANILFRGRNACCSAVDVAYVEIPPGGYGCAVPVAFKIGNVISNTTTIAVAENGRICTPTEPATAAQGNIADWLASDTFSSGAIGLQRSVSVTPELSVGGVNVPSTTVRMDSASATFSKITMPPGGVGLGNVFDIANFGACRVYSFEGQIPEFSVTSLDAGDPITVSGPPGNFALQKTVFPGVISYSLLLDQTGSTIVPGTYTVAGPGGPDVGSFSVDISVPPALVWTNQESILEVDRSSGVTVTWTGGDPNGYVQVNGYSFIQSNGTNVITASFDCTARTTDGQFTVPPIVLLALPPTGTQNVGGFEIPAFTALSVNSYSIEHFLTSGIEFGSVVHTIVNDRGVMYK